MSQDAASLDRLHGIVMPDPVPWWPPAPGWYVLIAIAALLAIRWAAHAWKKWRANAYRRQALRELASARDAAAMAAILRRTALVVAPRTEIAGLTGDAWVDWLDRHAPVEASVRTRERLARDLYSTTGEVRDDEELRPFAVAWLRRHESTAPD